MYFFPSDAVKVNSNLVGFFGLSSSRQKGVTGTGSPAWRTEEFLKMLTARPRAMRRLLFPEAFAPNMAISESAVYSPLFSRFSGWFRSPDGSRLSTASSRIEVKFEHLNRSSMAPPLSGF